MKVTNVTYGGKYFYGSHEELEALFGHKNVDGDKMEVVKEAWKGSTASWKIIAWRRDKGSHGRRDTNEATGDWKVGDIIMSKACYKGNHLVSIR